MDPCSIITVLLLNKNLKTMNLNREEVEPHAIEAYSDAKIQINSIVYESSLIVSKEEIISNLTIKSIQNLDEPLLQQLVHLQPELILIGHKEQGKFLPMPLMNQLTQQRIGIECMSVGAACRTYNVLLGEHRAVVALFIF